MRYVFAAKAAALPDGGKLKAGVEGRDILLTRFGDEIFAIDNKCTHMGGSLADGHFEGGLVSCPRHGATFDLKTGKAVRGGKMGPIKFTPPDTRAYPVKVEGEDIRIGVE
jgi:3-phenylpropionate/trans-cinnamate dioxygenase ferredoxin subunit